MTLQFAARPEDRHGRGVESLHWADTHPACFRSEAFAEDLRALLDSRPVLARSSDASSRRRSKEDLERTTRTTFESRSLVRRKRRR